MTNYESLSSQVRECALRVAESGAAGLSGLYDLTAVRLVRYAVTITRNQHDAEDVVQTCLVRVVANPRILTHVGLPWSYLLGMVRNESLVILRKKRRWSIVDGLSDLITRRSVDEVEQEDSYRAIWLALRTLPVEQREVVVLKIWEDLTFEQIGEVLHVPSSTAASRYRYGIKKLASKLHFLHSEEVREAVHE
ncbi:MAG: sigma-70 family RNA polymerase sigma factor [Pirellula sp.]